MSNVPIIDSNNHDVRLVFLTRDLVQSFYSIQSADYKNVFCFQERRWQCRLEGKPEVARERSEETDDRRH